MTKLLLWLKSILSIRITLGPRAPERRRFLRLPNPRGTGFMVLDPTKVLAWSPYDKDRTWVEVSGTFGDGESGFRVGLTPAEFEEAMEPWVEVVSWEFNGDHVE
jgi:hypothetical protein